MLMAIFSRRIPAKPMANISLMGALAHGGALQLAMHLYGGAIEDWLDLSTGINPNPAPMPKIDDYAFQRLPEEDQYQATLRAAQHFYGATGAGLLAAGTQPIIMQLPRLMAGKKAQIIGPTYGEYARILAQNGIAFEHVETVEHLTAPWCFVINPDNPSGRSETIDQLEKIADNCAHQGGCLVVDEAFADVLSQHSMIGKTGRDGLIVLRSFGKFFGLAGIRLSSAFGPPQWIEWLKEWIGPWPVSGPALAIGEALYKDRQCHQTLRRTIEMMHIETKAALEQQGFNIIGDGGLFLTVEHSKAHAIHLALKKAHVLTRVFDYRADWIRFGLCKNKQDVNRLIQRLDVLNQVFKI